ncbi:MAG TPA: 3-hydroxyacyl-[acyl-carrier-protein] dehydratase FabZ, partial [Salinarimonas sp.]|nr:3-hydroxyacyl-[acyl-carrier-protein] dehydratase FabZ [Salinarimonas sp.]
GAICVAAALANKAKPKQVFFMTIDKAKFRRPVQPGDVLEYHMRKTANRRNMWWFFGEAKVGGAVVAEAEVSAMLVTE